MFNFSKSKKAFYMAIAAGVFGFATYGIYHTAHAFGETSQCKTNCATYNLSSTGIEKSPVPDGTFCNPYGCTGCSGCVSLQYQQNIESLPADGTRVEESD